MVSTNGEKEKDTSMHYIQSLSYLVIKTNAFTVTHLELKVKK